MAPRSRRRASGRTWGRSSPASKLPSPKVCELHTTPTSAAQDDLEAQASPASRRRRWTSSANDENWISSRRRVKSGGSSSAGAASSAWFVERSYCLRRSAASEHEQRYLPFSKFCESVGRRLKLKPSLPEALALFPHAATSVHRRSTSPISISARGSAVRLSAQAGCALRPRFMPASTRSSPSTKQATAVVRRRPDFLPVVVRAMTGCPAAKSQERRRRPPACCSSQP